MLNSENLKKGLKNFRGSLVQYSHPLSELKYSEGANYFIQNAEAHWFLDIIASFFPTKEMRNFLCTYLGADPNSGTQLKFGSYLVELISNGKRASIIITKASSEDKKNLLDDEYENFPTNCPAGKWVFYLNEQDVLNKDCTRQKDFC